MNPRPRRFGNGIVVGNGTPSQIPRAVEGPSCPAPLPDGSPTSIGARERVTTLPGPSIMAVERHIFRQSTAALWKEPAA